MKHDAAKGHLCADRIVNNGTIEIFSSDEHCSVGIVEAESISGTGSILSALPELSVHVRNLSLVGTIFAEEHVTIKSAANLKIDGGYFESKRADFIAATELNVNAHSINSNVSVCADNAAFGVAAGDLHVVGSQIAGDPIWYNRAGNLDITAGPTGGDDL